jgi:hypothetical protein
MMWLKICGDKNPPHVTIISQRYIFTRGLALNAKSRFRCHIVGLVFLSVLFLAACQPSNSTLLVGRWQVVQAQHQVNGSVQNLPLNGGTYITEFKADGSYVGNGANRGTYRLINNDRSIYIQYTSGPSASTDIVLDIVSLTPSQLVTSYTVSPGDSTIQTFTKVP